MPAYTDRDLEQWDATSTAAPFDPRAEIPALLTRIKELSIEFTCDGMPGTEFEREARECAPWSLGSTASCTPSPPVHS